MSVSRHPVALRLENTVGDGTKLLATVMALPLLDGIFPALLLAGALDSPLGILQTGLLIFGGSATLAVVLVEMEGTRREQVGKVLLVGAVVIAVAAVEAALAPTVEALVNLEIFTRFAALVILAVAAKTASATIGEYLPGPGAIILLGLVASVEPANASLTFVTDPALVVRGVAAAGVGVAFALSVAVFGPWLRGAVDIDRFRFGSAVALGVLPFSLLGPPALQNAPIALVVLVVTSLLAFDPDGRGDPLPAEETSGPVADGGPTPDEPVEADADAEGTEGDARPPREREEDDRGSPGISDSDRAPWL
jgi:ethanolamine utilization microcompartment shell protein EutS